MKPQALGTIAKWCEGELSSGAADRFVTRVCTDSRAIQPGDLFVALKGENFDGHEYAVKAIDMGAIAVVVEQSFDLELKECAGVVRVQDTLKSLQTLARSYRESLDIKIVGITGSNGKTSTKEYVRAVLSSRWKTSATQGNFNNHIGLPLTLLSFAEDDQWGVVEMGMNHPGEIKELVEIAQPDAGVVTNVGWAHIEFFEDCEGIAQEKGELIVGLKEDGLAILNGDDSRVFQMSEWTKARSVKAGFNQNSDYVLKTCDQMMDSQVGVLEVKGSDVEIKLDRPGPHLMQNASLAASLGFELGLSVGEVTSALKKCVLPGGRLKMESLSQGWLIDDSYNANPDSVIAGLKTLAGLPGDGRSVVFLGTMAELGSRSEELHKEVGRMLSKLGVDELYATGDFSEAYISGAKESGMSGDSLIQANSHEDLVKIYKEKAVQNDKILVKGSRSSQMEAVVALLKESQETLK